MLEVEDNRLILEDAAVVGAKPFVVVGISAFNEEHSIARVMLGSRYSISRISKKMNEKR